MTLVEIENFKAEELKARKAELIEAATKAGKGEFSVADLAARYVQARTDAAMRDAKLHDQGTTITHLNTMLADLQAKLAEATNDLAVQVRQNEDQAARMESVLLGTAEERRTSVEQVNAAKVEIEKLRAERDAALQLAKARRAVLADVMTVINAKVGPLLAAE